jgi:hypothetical protein
MSCRVLCRVLLICTVTCWPGVIYAIQVTPDMSMDELVQAASTALESGESCQDVVNGMMAAGIASADIVEAVLAASSSGNEKRGAGAQKKTEWCDVTEIIITILTERPDDAYEVVSRAFYLLGPPAKERIRLAADSVESVDQDAVERALTMPYRERVEPVRDPGGTASPS